MEVRPDYRSTVLVDGVDIREKIKSRGARKVSQYPPTRPEYGDRLVPGEPDTLAA